ncbi:hypothetical protein [Actinoplanes derwentensis]|nr:hypothetical protein [Actinoplanes derwentensis]
MLVLGSSSDQLNPIGISRVDSPVPLRAALSRIERYLTQLDILRVVFDEKRREQTFRDHAQVSVLVRDMHDASGAGGLERGGFERFRDAGFPTEAFELDAAPIRIGLLHRRGIVTHMILLLSHLPFDGVAFRLLERQLLTAIEGHEVPEPGMQTETLVRHEQAPGSIRRSEAVLERWVDAATSPPAGRGLMPTTPGAYSVIALRSRAAAIAAQVIALRTGTSTTSVVLAALTRAVHHEIDRDLSAMLLVCNNRWQPQLTQFIGQTLGNGLLRYSRQDLTGEMTSHVRAVYARTLNAYARARYDTLRWRDTLTGLAAAGLSSDLSYYFNDVRAIRQAWQGLESQAGELGGPAERETSIDVIERRDLSDATVFANLRDAGPECLLKVVCDEKRMTPDAGAAMLAALEAVLVREAKAI